MLWTGLTSPPENFWLELTRFKWTLHLPVTRERVELQASTTGAIYLTQRTNILKADLLNPICTIIYISPQLLDSRPHRPFFFPDGLFIVCNIDVCLLAAGEDQWHETQPGDAACHTRYRARTHRGSAKSAEVSKKVNGIYVRCYTKTCRFFMLYSSLRKLTTWSTRFFLRFQTIIY